MKPCVVAGIGTAIPASERDVSEEQQVAVLRAVGAIPLLLPVCLGDLIMWLKLERDRQVCRREYWRKIGPI